MYDLRSKTIFFRDITPPSSRLFPPAVSPPPCAFMIAPNFGKKRSMGNQKRSILGLLTLWRR